MDSVSLFVSYNLDFGVNVVCVFFSATAGYMDLRDVFKFGFIMAVVNLVIWGVVGTFWWKFLGLY